MRAALLEAPGKPLALVDDVDVAEPGPGQVRVRIRHCGVCHSDLSVADGSFPSPVPVILGHEAAGEVESVGPGVARVAPGDPVVLTPCPPCGTCAWCVRGQPTLCVNSAAIASGAFPDGSTGLGRRGGAIYRGLGVAAFAELALLPETAAVAVPKDVPLDVACLIGCAVQTGVGAALNTARLEPGAAVLVLGLGGVGLSVVQGARLAGASRILVSDPVAARREAAARFGATDLLDPTADDVVAAAHEATAGLGADVAFETAGRGALVATALAAVRNGGTVVCVGAPPITEAITVAPAALLVATEKRIVGSLLGSCHSLRDIPRFVALWRAGRLDLEGLVTKRRPLAEVNDALDDLRAARGIRTVLSLQ